MRRTFSFVYKNSFAKVIYLETMVHGISYKRKIKPATTTTEKNMINDRNHQ